MALLGASRANQPICGGIVSRCKNHSLAFFRMREEEWGVEVGAVDCTWFYVLCMWTLIHPSTSRLKHWCGDESYRLNAIFHLINWPQILGHKTLQVTCLIKVSATKPSLLSHFFKLLCVQISLESAFKISSPTIIYEAILVLPEVKLTNSNTKRFI